MSVNPASLNKEAARKAKILIPDSCLQVKKSVSLSFDKPIIWNRIDDHQGTKVRRTVQPLLYRLQGQLAGCEL